MKAKHFSVLLLFTFQFLLLIPNGFTQHPESGRMVRLIYFVPKDRTPQPDMSVKLDILMKGVQQFYANEMERHGFGRKTFHLETNATGKVVVHRINGQFADTYYRQRIWNKVWEETSLQFDRSQHIYFAVVDISNEHIGPGNTVCGRGGNYGDGGGALVPASGHCFEGEHGFTVAAHELGHAFGLGHDFRSGAYIMSYGHYPDQLSRCAAEWLNAHRYFNDPPTPPNNHKTTIEMLSSESDLDYAVRFRFKVNDADGLRHSHLIAPETSITENSGYLELIGCEVLKGNSQTLEFVTNQLTTRSNSITLRVVDAAGNFSEESYPVDINALLPTPRVISIRDANLAAAIREKLGLGEKSRITQLDVLNLTSINLVNKQITKLNGLEHAKNLKSLFLNFNQITDISTLAKLVNLETLYIDPVDDLTPIKALTRLRALVIHGYDTRNVPLDLSLFTSLPDLVHLTIDSNGIADITPLTQLKQLRFLSVIDNQISDIRPLTKLVNLTTLRVAGNPIADKAPLQALLDQNPNIEIDVDPKQLTPIVRFMEPESPPIYWIDTETSGFYRLVGTKQIAENVALGVPDMTSLAIDTHGDRAYWIEPSGKKRGEIGSANLEGSDVQRVRWIYSLPLDIAIDPVARNLYATNTNGKILRLSLNGANFNANFVTNLNAPKHIAVDATGRKLYWTEAGERIRRANLNGLNVQTVITELETPGGLTVTGDKLYWTEQTGEKIGKIQRANLDGTNVQTLATLKSVPLGIAVDISGGKVYWTNAAGRIQRANLNGENIQSVVMGLGNPIDLALGTATGNMPVAAAPAVILPESTNLLSNYPNPFNPETWIPYHLSEFADVTLHIYATNGVLVRTLVLGYQPAGIYHSQSRAAYWDGRNKLGEKVASGIYFYTLTAGDFTATRKMLIVK